MNSLDYRATAGCVFRPLILCLIASVLLAASGCRSSSNRPSGYIKPDFDFSSRPPVETPASRDVPRSLDVTNDQPSQTMLGVDKPMQVRKAPAPNSAHAGANDQMVRPAVEQSPVAPEAELAASRGSWFSRLFKPSTRKTQANEALSVPTVIADVVPAQSLAAPGVVATEKPERRSWFKWGARTEKQKSAGAGLSEEELAAIDREMVRAAAAAAVELAPSTKAISQVLLRPGLLLDIKVMVAGRNQLEPAGIRVSEQGAIFLPMLGLVPVESLSIEALRDELTSRYREYYVNPEVLVDFARDSGSQGLAPWGYVTVLGRVKNPGRIMIPPTRDLTVSGAIQGAGGFDKSARINAIRVTRNQPDQKGQTRFTVNLNAVGSDGKSQDDFILGMDDIVFVPEARF